MDKKIALVTGGTGGIGTALSQRFGKEYHVIACYYKEGRHDEAEAWQQAQEKAGLDIEIAYANIVNFNDCKTLVQNTIDNYGHIDVLINNAGITADSMLKNMNVQQWQQVIDTNLTSVFNITRNVLPFMLNNRYGRIISISSINGRKGQFGQCNYASSKAGLFGFTKSLALEVAKTGITVNTISPGYIDTPMLNKLNDSVLQEIIANIPMGRLGQASEIAHAAFFLASNEAGFMTGANLDINGGQYM